VGLKPTIYKFDITLSDLNRQVYDALNLTIALHPSETIERMMVRVLAFCMNAQERLMFSKGISAPDEPDIWSHTLDNQISLWIDVGEPAVDRIKKATRQSSAVKIYSFNSKSNAWWKQGQKHFNGLPVSVFQFEWKTIQSLATLAQRTLDLSVTISDQSAYVASKDGECDVPWVPLQVIP